MQVSPFFWWYKGVAPPPPSSQPSFFSRRGRPPTSLHICVIFICEGVPPYPLPAGPHPRQHTVRPRRRGRALAQSRSDPGRKMFACQRDFAIFIGRECVFLCPFDPGSQRDSHTSFPPLFGSGGYLVHGCRSAVLPQNGVVLPLLNADLEIMKGVGYEGSFDGGCRVTVEYFKWGFRFDSIR